MFKNEFKNVIKRKIDQVLASDSITSCVFKNRLREAFELVLIS